MLTISRTFIAGLAACLLLSTTANSEARDFSSVIRQVAKAYQQQGPSNGRLNPNSRQNHRMVLSSNFRGGNGSRLGGDHLEHLPIPPGLGFPPPHCGGGYCPPPPPPRICYVYIVYYYDCHFGWKYYGEYNNQHAAQLVVHGLEAQGYRSYIKKVAH